MIANTLTTDGNRFGGPDIDTYIAGPLGGGNDGIGRRTEDDPNLVPVTAGVRRLTPTEAERLQAFPDGWTQLGDTPDSKRYAALGDAVTVTVAHWIASRIASEFSAAHGGGR